MWRTQPPSAADFPHADEIFPAASYQYVLYGMGAPPPLASVVRSPARGDTVADAAQKMTQRARALAASLPTNRVYFDGLRRSEPLVQKAIHV